MLIEFFDCFDEVPIQRHGVVLGVRRLLSHLERREQPGGVAVVGQRPSQRRGHPVGMIGTERVSLTRADGRDQIVQPDGTVVVAERHDSGAGATATSTGLNHVLNLEGAEGQTKDLRPIRLRPDGRLYASGTIRLVLRRR